MPVRAVLFDFDGTLADSFPAITASTNYVRGKYNLTPVTEDELRMYVGLGLANLMERMVPTADPATAVSLYREHHPSVMNSGTRLFNGVADTVAALHRGGFRLAVCSNKAVHFTRALVESLGLSPYFRAVLGPEDVGEPKPHPAMLLEGCRRLEVSPDESIYIGDMAVDVHTARAAGMPVWLVTGGATGMESATAAGPDHVLDTFDEILRLIIPPA